MNTNYCCETSNETQLLARIWNERLGKLIKKNFGTQKEFAQKFKETFGVGNQADVSRWINVGTLSAKGKMIGFPEYPTMKKIATFFNVTVGYLTGETDYETFEMERTCKYLGIIEGTGNVIKYITGSSHDCIEWGKQAGTYQRIINNLLIAEQFPTFIRDLKELDAAYYDDTQRYEELKRTYGETLLNEVAELQCDKKIDYEYDPSAPKLTNIQIEAQNALKKDEDKSYDNSFKLKLARYELHEDFERLIDSLYPR